MLKKVNTELLLEEIETDGHAPLKFICSNQDIYYCKYLNSFSRLEINCLAYEIIANFLLKKLQIPTPEIALVNISKNTLDKSKIYHNTRLREGNTCFGSKEIKFATEIQSIQDYSNKADFNRLVNPEDIIKIAIFDLWVDNKDRGRHFPGGINYNLLLEPIESKQKIIAFDNAFIFGGIESIGIFNPLFNVNSSNKLIETGLYKDIVKHIDINNFKEIVNNFIHLLHKSYFAEINNLMLNLPKEWTLTPNLGTRIDNFLTDKNHINRIKNIVLNSKKK